MNDFTDRASPLLAFGPHAVQLGHLSRNRGQRVDYLALQGNHPLRSGALAQDEVFK